MFYHTGGRERETEGETERERQRDKQRERERVKEREEQLLCVNILTSMCLYLFSDE